MNENAYEFENEVRRIARYRWPSAEYSGSTIAAGRERDGVFVTEECIHLLECTISRQRDKALEDLQKLFALYKQYRKSHPEQAIKCWFVTLHEPTADQRSCRTQIKGAPPEIFNILSFQQFQSRLVDSFEYLQARDNHKFGSVYDPRTGSTTQTPNYIDVGLRRGGQQSPTTARELAEVISAGGRLVILGEYGVGKSMTLREIYRILARRHRESKSPRFPVFLNLREHQGQQEPAEILERHARNIGFRFPSQLVRAWKAGYIHLFLDGFDEVSSLGLQGAWRRLRDARYANMAGVRSLVRESPPDIGIAIAGRENFFDTADERKRALGESAEWQDVRLDEFTDAQIRELVQQFGYKGKIPPWIPTRPLLLSTLFARGISADTSTALSVLTEPAAGWDMLITEVCSREARIEHGISGENIRSILESLATLARSKDNGLGPVSPQDIVSLFQAECGFLPTDEALVVLQRLPGLGRDSTGGEDSRCFVDSEFADACRAGDLVRFASNPYDSDVGVALSATKVAIGQTGISIAAHRLRNEGFNEGRLTAAAKAIQRLPSSGAIPADLVQLAVNLGLPIGQPIVVSNLLFQRMEVPEGREDFPNVTFSDCYFNELEVPAEVLPACCPVFNRCLIQELEGRVSLRDLPENRFRDCVIESFASTTGTTAGTLDLSIPVGAQVLVSVLKKLFVQSLGGRKENAFYRGLDGVHQNKVSAILGLIKRYGLAQPSGKAGDPIWLPVRWQRSRVMTILEAPSSSQDPVIIEARKM